MFQATAVRQQLAAAQAEAEAAAASVPETDAGAEDGGDVDDAAAAWAVEKEQLEQQLQGISQKLWATTNELTTARAEVRELRAALPPEGPAPDSQEGFLEEVVSSPLLGAADPVPAPAGPSLFDRLLEGGDGGSAGGGGGGGGGAMMLRQDLIAARAKIAALERDVQREREEKEELVDNLKITIQELVFRDAEQAHTIKTLQEDDSHVFFFQSPTAGTVRIDFASPVTAQEQLATLETSIRAAAAPHPPATLAPRRDSRTASMDDSLNISSSDDDDDGNAVGQVVIDMPREPPSPAVVTRVPAGHVPVVLPPAPSSASSSGLFSLVRSILSLVYTFGGADEQQLRLTAATADVNV